MDDIDCLPKYFLLFQQFFESIESVHTLELLLEHLYQIWVLFAIDLIDPNRVHELKQ